MKVTPVSNSESWNKPLLEKNSSFLQSWQWGETLESTGQKVGRLVVEDGDVLAQAQVVYKPLPFGWKYALCPKGPVVFSDENKVYQALLDYLKKQGCVFFRVEPEKEVNGEEFVVRETEDINPRATLVLNVSGSEEGLLANMHHKTRYNLRLAKKKDLRLSEEKNFEIFWDLIQKTGRRNQFALHPKHSYSQAVMSPLVYQRTVYHQDQPASTGCFIGFGSTLYYLYGASDHSLRQLMSPYLIQWQGIKLAKSLGYKYYDFFGVAPKTSNGEGYEYDQSHVYSGITKFKLGFGGEFKQEAGTMDIVVDKGKYPIYRALRNLRKLWRRY